jgi:hypothetical protein
MGGDLFNRHGIRLGCVVLRPFRAEREEISHIDAIFASDARISSRSCDHTISGIAVRSRWWRAGSAMGAAQKRSPPGGSGFSKEAQPSPALIE